MQLLRHAEQTGLDLARLADVGPPHLAALARNAIGVLAQDCMTLAFRLGDPDLGARAARMLLEEA